MLIYNTTYHVEEGQEKYFLTWMQEFYLPEVREARCAVCSAHCTHTKPY